jgi:hypothetical protein
MTVMSILYPLGSKYPKKRATRLARDVYRIRMCFGETLNVTAYNTNDMKQYSV